MDVDSEGKGEDQEKKVDEIGKEKPDEIGKGEDQDEICKKLEEEDKKLEDAEDDPLIALMEKPAEEAQKDLEAEQKQWLQKEQKRMEDFEITGSLLQLERERKQIMNKTQKFRWLSNQTRQGVTIKIRPLFFIFFQISL